jgi:hypothetical protein
MAKVASSEVAKICLKQKLPLQQSEAETVHGSNEHGKQLSFKHFNSK